jgi:hypothetical protein
MAARNPLTFQEIIFLITVFSRHPFLTIFYHIPAFFRGQTKKSMQKALGKLANATT